MAPDCVGPEVEAMLPAPGEVLLLENLRFHAEEEKNDPAFAQQLAALCDLYVNDAFGSAHRAHASTEGMITFVPQAAAGLLMEQELEYLGMVTSNPPRPCVAILGGAKVSDKIEVIENLGKVVDKLLIGGAMAYTFLRAQGHATGKSLVEEDKIELAQRADGRARRQAAAAGGSRGGLGDRSGRGQRGGEAHSRRQDRASISGRRPSREFSQVIAGAKTIIWNGPMGIFEKPPVRQRHGGAGQSRGRFRRRQRGGRRRFREGHQGRRRDVQDLATSPPAAARRWNSWPASNCPAWRRSIVNTGVTVVSHCEIGGLLTVRLSRTLSVVQKTLISTG